MKNSTLIIRRPRPLSTSYSRTTPKAADRLNSFVSTNESLFRSDSSPHQITNFSKNEFVRLDKQLDAYEISVKNSNSKFSVEFYQSYLKDLSINIRNFDITLANRVLRGVLGCEKAMKLARNNKEVSQAPKSLSVGKRENFTQTLEGKLELEELCPDTQKDTQFVKNLIQKVGKLRAPKMLHRLFDIHENLCQLDTDLPTPTQSPEPIDQSLNLVEQKTTIFVNMLKNQIKQLLSKSKIVAGKAEKFTQTVIISEESESLNEKLTEIVRLKDRVKDLDCEIEILKQEITRLKLNLQESEWNFNQTNMQLIQVSSRLRTCEDQLRTSKQKVTTLSESIVYSKEKKERLKKKLLEKEKMVHNQSEELQLMKTKMHDLILSFKVSEEKLGQIEAAWIDTQAKEFEYKKVSSIEIASKYKLYKELNSVTHNTNGGLDTRAREYQRRHSEFQGDIRKHLIINSKGINEQRLSESMTRNNGGFTPIVRENFMFSHASEDNSYHNIHNRTDSLGVSSSHLSTIMENSPISAKHTGEDGLMNINLAIPKDSESAGLDHKINGKVVSKMHLHKNTLSKLQIVRDPLDINSPGFDYFSPDCKTPLLKQLIGEQEILFNNASKSLHDKLLHIEINSKSTQCS